MVADGVGIRGGVEEVEDGQPVGGGLDGDEGAGDGLGVGVVARELDAELAHHHGGAVLAVEALGELKVVGEDLALLSEGGRLGGGEEVVLEESAGLGEDPGVADAAPGDADGVDAGLLDHGEDVVSGPDVAGAEDAEVFGAAVALDQVLEEGPV